MTPNHEDSIKQETLVTLSDHTAEAWRVRIRYFRWSLGLTSFRPPLVCLTVHVGAFPTLTIILVTTPAVSFRRSYKRTPPPALSTTLALTSPC